MPMGRLYTAVFSAVAVTAQQDFWEIAAPADAVVFIHDFILTQSTDVGDAAEEGLSILMKRGATTTGTGGTQAITPSPLSFGDPAFGGVIDINNTTKATSGTIVTLASWNWNIRMPFQIIWTPETRPMLSPSQRLTIELATTPADSLTISGTCTFEECGG
jgi:hypothetical protein